MLSFMKIDRTISPTTFLSIMLIRFCIKGSIWKASVSGAKMILYRPWGNKINLDGAPIDWSSWCGGWNVRKRLCICHIFSSVGKTKDTEPDFSVSFLGLLPFSAIMDCEPFCEAVKKFQWCDRIRVLPPEGYSIWNPGLFKSWSF